MFHKDVRRARGRFNGKAAEDYGSRRDRVESPGSLDDARKRASDPRIAVGHYLEAANAATRSLEIPSEIRPPE